jgi:hypothetical protein
MTRTGTVIFKAKHKKLPRDTFVNHSQGRVAVKRASKTDIFFLLSLPRYDVQLDVFLFRSDGAVLEQSFSLMRYYF